MWEGPQGVGAQGQVLGFSSCLGTRLAGGGGGGQGGSPQPLSKERRASGQRGGASPQPDTPRCRLFSPCLSRGSGDQEAQEKRRPGVGHRTGVQRPCPSSNLKALITAFGESPGGRKGATPVCLGQGRVLPAFHEPKGN